MADFVDTLALKTGMRPEQARKGLDALALTFRELLPDQVYSTITAIIPATRASANAETENLRNQLDFWGSGLPAMNRKPLPKAQTPLAGILQQLTRSGFSMQEANDFLPVVFQMLKRDLPADVLRQIDRSIPGLSNLTTFQQPGLMRKLRSLF